MQHHRTGGWTPHALSALGLLCHTFSTGMVSQKVLCLGFARGNGITPLSLILLLYIYFLMIKFMGGVSFLNFHYFYLLPLEFILFVTLLILFHHFFLTSHHFPTWKRFVISKHTQTHTHTHLSAAQSNGRLLDYLPEWCQQRKNRCQRHSS